MGSVVIQLRFCEIEFTDWGCETRFSDGGGIRAEPHPGLPHYHVISHRCGYGDDILRYCQEHEFCHAFVAEQLCGTVSHVLHTLAHGKKQNRGMVILEEMAAQQFQRWLRANERPIVSGANWDDLKRDALELLGG
jgi:hypothetical protein